jgi:hypothetical protein
MLHVVSGSTGGLKIDRYVDTANGPGVTQRKARGSSLTPAAVIADDVLGGYTASGYDGANFDSAGYIRHRVSSISGGNVASYIEFTTSDTSGTVNDAMRIDPNGNVGIGTTEPTASLHVIEPSGAYPAVKIEGQLPGVNPSIRFVENDGKYAMITLREAHGDVLQFWTSDANEVVTIKQNGNVGIGTISPQGTLDVNGTIYQRGGLLHADYVFESGYELESIEQHSKLMWQDKHLPGIPERKLNENGQEIVEVGAHQRGIVEELEKAHIYIEHLLNQNKALEERVAALEEMVLHRQFVSTKENYNETQ